MGTHLLASLGSKGKNGNSLACLRNAGSHSAVTYCSPKGSCVVRIPKAFWTEDVQQKPFELKLIAMEEMSSWGLGHDLGRYAVCLRKVGGGDPPSAV